MRCSDYSADGGVALLRLGSRGRAFVLSFWKGIIIVDALLNSPLLLIIIYQRGLALVEGGYDRSKHKSLTPTSINTWTGHRAVCGLLFVVLDGS